MLYHLMVNKAYQSTKNRTGDVLIITYYIYNLLYITYYIYAVFTIIINTMYIIKREICSIITTNIILDIVLK